MTTDVRINKHLTVEELRQWVVDHTGEYHAEAEYTGKVHNRLWGKDEHFFKVTCKDDDDITAKVRMLSNGVMLFMKAYNGDWQVIDTVTYEEMEL